MGARLLAIDRTSNAALLPMSVAVICTSMVLCVYIPLVCVRGYLACPVALSCVKSCVQHGRESCAELVHATVCSGVLSSMRRLAKKILIRAQIHLRCVGGAMNRMVQFQRQPLGNPQAELRIDRTARDVRWTPL